MPNDPTHLHQIYYSLESRNQLDPKFLPLDNTHSPRPDWYEIYPILRFFHERPISNRDWYGFFSPRFTAKTGLIGSHVTKAISSQCEHTDAVLFSAPLRRQFANVFQQGEASHPGLISTAHELLHRWGIDIDLRHEKFKRKHAVFSNYFVARGSVWGKWLPLATSLAEIADDPHDPLFLRLNAQTTYRAELPGVQMKVFIAERLVSLIFHLYPDIRVDAVRPSDPCKWLPRPLRQVVGCRRRT